MPVCAIKGCFNNPDKNKYSDISFHKFPSDPLMSARWTDIIRLNRNESYWKPSKSSLVCSVHFDDKDKYITKTGKNRIRTDAAPNKNISVFCASIDDQRLLAGIKSGQRKRETNTPVIATKTDDTLLGDDNISDEQRLKRDNSASKCADAHDPGSPDSALSNIFDTPKEAALRKELNKKIAHIKVQSRQIKTLRQKIHRLTKSVLLLKSIKRVKMRKKREVNNDTSAAPLHNSIMKEERKV